VVGAPIGSVGCAVEAEFCEQRALPGYAGRRFPLARIGWAVGRRLDVSERAVPCLRTRQAEFVRRSGLHSLFLLLETNVAVRDTGVGGSFPCRDGG